MSRTGAVALAVTALGPQRDGSGEWPSCASWCRASPPSRACD